MFQQDAAVHIDVVFHFSIGDGVGRQLDDRRNWVSGRRSAAGGKQHQLAAACRHARHEDRQAAQFLRLHRVRGSKVIITGDASQKDLPRDATSGLDVAMKVLKKIDDIGFCQLTSKDVVRHPLVQQIVQAYDAYEKKQKPERPARRRNGVNER